MNEKDLIGCTENCLNEDSTCMFENRAIFGIFGGKVLITKKF